MCLCLCMASRALRRKREIVVKEEEEEETNTHARTHISKEKQFVLFETLLCAIAVVEEARDESKPDEAEE